MTRSRLFMPVVLAAVFGLYSAGVRAQTQCFLIQEGGKTLLEQGDCDRRDSPNSTFKIAISYMGFDSGILIDPHHPLIPYQAGYADWLPRWKQPHDPELWITNSCVWYSQVITQKLGMKKFQDYLSQFHYGNENGQGDPIKQNGLTDAWLDTSLLISPREQIQFLQRSPAELKISSRAAEMTKKIIYQGELIPGWKIYGKTGSGHVLRQGGKHDEKFQAGWFVGWAEQGKRKVWFAVHINDEKPESDYAGPRAKDKTIQLLKQVLA